MRECCAQSTAKAWLWTLQMLLQLRLKLRRPLTGTHSLQRSEAVGNIPLLAHPYFKAVFE
jgi:hypothetical protein